MQFSANLGFLFTDRSLPEAIHAAAKAGFDAVECHFPYEIEPDIVRAALQETELPMLGLNTIPGDRTAGDFGLAAMPGREREARAAIDQAIEYAAAIAAHNVHVMAGKSGGSAEAEAVYRDNLAYACDRAAAHGITILIEPINQDDVPGYHLSRVEQAAETIAAVERANLKIMFDVYHTQIMQGDLVRRFERHRAHIGHVQIAAVPDRGEPDAGEVNHMEVLRAFRAAGWQAPVGAEYRPRTGRTEDGLAWLKAFQGL